MESELPPPPYDSCVLKNKGADILVQNAYKNQIWSPLLRLPDKTLIALMKSLDLDSLLRLRHTSRIFMWLFSSDAGFKQYHLTPEEDKDRFYDTARIWTPPSSWFKNQAASPFRGMCQQCATTRKGHVFGKALLKSMPELYCSRCHTKHRSMHFSRGQRLLPEKKKPRGMSTTSWMPVSWPVAGNPLRIFDPNLCDCVEWRGSSPEAKRMRWPICPDPARPWRSAADERFYVSTEPRCSKHAHNILASFTDAKAEIWVQPCQGRDDLLVLFQRATYYISEACGSGWQDMVYNQSYDMEFDDKMRGVTWCPNQTCAVSNLLRSNKHLWNMESRDRMGPSWPRHFV
ncbi:hypothetical protein MY4824_008909 [Beauveria thailandica]